MNGNSNTESLHGVNPPIVARRYQQPNMMVGIADVRETGNHTDKLYFKHA